MALALAGPPRDYKAGLPPNMVSLARHIQSSLGTLEKQMLSDPFGQTLFRSTIDAIFTRRGALAADLDLRQRKSSLFSLSIRRLQNREQHLKRSRAQIRAKLKATLGSKISGRTQHIWMIRVGMADPSLNDMSNMSTISALSRIVIKQNASSQRGSLCCFFYDHASSSI